MANRQAFLLAAFAIALNAQSAKTVLDGVYTEAQAERGQAAYSRSCARCHGAGLDGGGQAPTLHTSIFLDVWREDYLSSLFQHIQTRMPPGSAAGSLPEGQYIDIVAYLLSMNEFPTGARDLSRADLDSTLLVGLSGPQSLPAGATVRVVGCLALSKSEWSLIRAGEPSRTRSGEETNPGELEASAKKALGNQIFRLRNQDELKSEAVLQAQLGLRMQVKGVLSIQDNGYRIYALSMEPVPGNCGQ